MKYLVLIIIFLFSSVQAVSWLEYDVHLTCKLEKSCSINSGKCSYSGPSQTFHFSLDSDLNNWKKYRTCTKNSYSCFDKYSRDHTDGIWSCVGDAGCTKSVITAISSNSVSAIEYGGLFDTSVDLSDGTRIVNGEKLGIGNIVEHIFDRTRGTMVEHWIDRCNDINTCKGVRLNHTTTIFPLHEKRVESIYSCLKIQDKLF